MKMLYTFSLTGIPGKEFLTACGISGLEGKTRKYIVIWSFSYATARASKNTAIGVVNKRDWKKKKKEAFVVLCEAAGFTSQFIVSQAQEQAPQSRGLSAFQRRPGGYTQSFLLQAWNLPELQPCASAKQQEGPRVSLALKWSKSLLREQHEATGPSGHRASKPWLDGVLHSVNSKEGRDTA